MRKSRPLPVPNLLVRYRFGTVLVPILPALDPNNPYFNPFMNCYRPQLDPNNPNPNQFLTFSNWYPQPPFYSQNEPTGDNVSDNQQDPDVDVVPETQPDAQQASLRHRHRRKEVPEKTIKPSITRWSESEEMALARAYIDVSEDLIVVQHHNNRKSGENDESVMNEALMAYARENGPFAHIAPWQVMWKSTKWHPVPKLQTSKRMKTSSSGKYTTTQSDSTGRCFVNLNESDEEVEIDMPPPTSTQRPPGRNKKGSGYKSLDSRPESSDLRLKGCVLPFSPNKNLEPHPNHHTKPSQLNPSDVYNFWQDITRVNSRSRPQLLPESTSSPETKPSKTASCMFSLISNAGGREVADDVVWRGRADQSRCTRVRRNSPGKGLEGEGTHRRRETAAPPFFSFPRFHGQNMHSCGQ
ncbi:hypothetical protein R6Q59_028978 [Mikania micrantha]